MKIEEERTGITFYYELKAHEPARPMVIIRDESGYPWICDKGVDPERDLKEQGCWQCGGLDMPFTGKD